MKQLIILILTCFISSISLFSQIEFSTRLGLSSLQDIGLEASVAISEKKAIYTSIDYRYQSFYVGSTGFISPELASSFKNNGFTIRLGVKSNPQNIKNNKLKNLGLTSSILYRRLEGVKTVRNSGLSGNKAEDKLKYLYQDLGFSFFRERGYKENIILYLNIGFGFRKESFINLKDFTLENNVKPLFLFDIGIRLKLFSIN